MLPLIKPNDIIHFVPIKPNQLQLNDIVIFRQKKRLIAHRLIYKTNQYFITQGDNLLNPDKPHSYSQLLGKAVSITRHHQTLPISYLYLQQSSLYLRELNLLVKTFNSHYFDYLFLKGLPLHLYYQKTHPQRLYLDCDLLINPHQLQPVSATLQQLGFHPYNPPDFSTPPFHQSPELSFIKKTPSFPIVLDIHLTPLFLPKQLATPNHLYPSTLLTQYSLHLLRNKLKVKLKNQTYPLISSKDAIIYLSLHFFHHNLRGIQRLHLLHQILTQYSFTDQEWAQLAQLANQFKLANFIYPSLKIYTHYFPSTIPKKFWQQLDLQHHFFINQLTKIDPLKPSFSRFLNGFRLTIYSFFLSPQSLTTKLKIFIAPTNYLNFSYLLLYKLFRYPLVLYKKLKHLL